MPTPTPRTFHDTLKTLRYGTLDDELTRELRALTSECVATNRPGKLTLELTIKPGKAGQIEVFDDVKVKPPKPEKGSTLMFATPENFLQREDPRQMQLDGLRQVDPETGEIRQVAQG